MEGTGVTPGLGRLRGKSAVVTGAAKGIGRATAELFAREGALLVLTDVDEAGLEELRERLAGEDVEVETVVGDVSIPEDAKAMIGAAVERFGRIDVLVANAGVIPLSTIVDATPEDWDQVLSVDGRGMFLTCKYTVEAMLETGGGSVVCLSSISGLAGQGQQAAYGPAKFVATGLTKHLAVEWAEMGIRVNAVAPGTILTEAVAELPDEYKEPMLEAHPVGRLGEPSEVANAILFLASDEASFITGAILPVVSGPLGAETGDRVPPGDLVGPAVVVDVRSLAEEGKPGVSPFITDEHVRSWEEENGQIREGEVVLLRTGWDRYYVAGEESPKYMHGSLVTGDFPGWPAPAPEMALYLHEKGIKTIGIDAPSIGSAHDPIPVHQAGLSRGMRYVEVLTNFGELPVRGAYFVFLPLKTAGRTGGPGRAIALVPDGGDGW